MRGLLKFIRVPSEIQFYLKPYKYVIMDDIEEVNIKRFRMDEIELNAKIAIIGKPGCFKAGTKILMFDETVKNVEDVKIGDQVMGDDFTKREVLQLCSGVDKMYKIEHFPGNTTTVNSKHKLVLIHDKTGEICEVKVKDFIWECPDDNWMWFRKFNPQVISKTKFTLYSIGISEYFGFTLDGNHRFLLEDHSVVRNTGKTSIIKDILCRHKKKFTKGILMSGTTDSSKDFDGVFPDIFIYNKYKQDVADNFWSKQKRIVRKRGRGNPKNMACFVIDDCMHEAKNWVSSETIADIFMNGRHYDLLFIVAMQYCMGISPSLRSCVDYVFILRENSFSNKKKLFDHYCSVFPDFKTFCKVLDALTVNYQCIVVKQRKNLSTKIEDNIFWYKAELHPDFRIGTPAMWEYHDRRYNRNYEDDNDAAGNDGTMKNHRAVIKDKQIKRGKGTLVINMRD
jgi:hypothetical protein